MKKWISMTVAVMLLATSSNVLQADEEVPCSPSGCGYLQSCFAPCLSPCLLAVGAVAVVAIVAVALSQDHHHHH